MKFTFGLLYIVVFKSSSMSHITGLGQPKYILPICFITCQYEFIFRYQKLERMLLFSFEICRLDRSKPKNLSIDILASCHSSFCCQMSCQDAKDQNDSN